MSTNDTFLAVFLGSKNNPRMKAWMALPEAQRRAKEQEGMAAWKSWMEKHHAAVVSMGGPLGKTKKITERGIDDVSNEMTAFVTCPGQQVPQTQTLTFTADASSLTLFFAAPGSLVEVFSRQ